ncbi:cupin domain-containing protein [Nocardiopsis aegyptia]|uniref:Quercetin dioxygenase-like cupin family protein n=1 Tax=Nocardiopsis aegyptia TaxID=220378 RepID=A0A7Z0J8Y0_9ACTN|nr:cupin domain-containing protein [Nocardiopsis aegyptia]NYJ32899.1 quercetin dioxygenase-like cupin family protein [Nocardiopsis aegyptia]
MPVVHSSTAPAFTMHNATFTGLAAPSRGARETCVWRTELTPGVEGQAHSLTREEVLVVLSGGAVATVDGTEHALAEGDALIVPPNTAFALANPHDRPCTLMAVLPVGGQAVLPEGEPFTPPWAR